MPFEMPQYWLHPEGIFTAQLTSWEEVTGAYGPRVKWVWETTGVEREDGKPPQLSYFTGMSFGAKSNLVAMLLAIGAAVPDSPEAAAAFNPDDLIGIRCKVEVRHKLQTDGSTWANIERFGPLRPARAQQPATAAPVQQPAAPARHPGAAEEDDCPDPSYNHDLQPGERGHDPFHECGRIRVAA